MRNVGGRGRRPDIVLMAGVAALAVIGFVLAKSALGPAGDRPRLDSRVAISSETTFRNVTGEPVSYTVKFDKPAPHSESRLLAPGAVDRFPASGSFEVLYESGGRTAFFIATAGMPYSFRYDEKGRVHIYPGSHGRTDAADLAPYVATPPEVVDKMLEMAALGPGDLLCDIGCGDGRIVVAAAKKHGAHAVGIDILPRLVELAAANARLAGVEDLTRFVCMDAMQADLTKATVVTLYLLPESNAFLEPKLEAELSPGARVISHGYTMAGWEERLIGSESVTAKDGVKHSIFAYRIGASSSGKAGQAQDHSRGGR